MCITGYRMTRCQTRGQADCLRASWLTINSNRASERQGRSEGKAISRIAHKWCGRSELFSA